MFVFKSSSLPIQFGPDKSQILRGIAIIFMIALHNGSPSEFKICVPIFTFLVGYGYAFAKEKNINHGLKRIWHLLSHFWLILLGLFLPVAIWQGDYHPTIENVTENMFGLESNLNWYSWYVYYYIYAMMIMIPASRIIDRFRLYGTAALIIISLCVSGSIRMIEGWSGNIWLQAIFDCFLCSPVMYAGYYLAAEKRITQLRVPHNTLTALLLTLTATAIFFLRGVPFATFFDFILIPVFIVSVVAIFNIIKWPLLHTLFIALGKESMNMWFFHAIFATTATAAIFAPLISWIHPKTIHILAMIIVSWLAGKMISAIYNTLRQ